MRNLIYSTIDYTKKREALRKLPVTWRDMSSSCAIPSWGEAICDEAYCLGDQTLGEIAFNSLKRHFPELELKWRKEEMVLLDHRPPKLFRFPVTGVIYYLDIRAAFKQFYKYLYLHSDFPYKRQKYSLYNLASEFDTREEEKYKIVRNAIVGITRSTRNKYVCKDKVWYVPKKNRFLSPTLWAQLMGILNQIAGQMIDYGAIWINSDGYAFTSEQGYLDAINYFNEREIIIGEQGQSIGYINGLNSVHIPGVKNTENKQGSTAIYHLETSEIDHINYWLLNRKAIEK